MVKSLKVGKFLSAKKGTEFCCFVFDLGYRQVKVFADSDTLKTVSGASDQVLYNLKVGESLPVKVGE